MELFSLSVAFVVLFGDTLHAVLGHFSSNQYKLLCFVMYVHHWPASSVDCLD